MPIPTPAVFSAIHDHYPHAAVALAPDGCILDVNARWIAYGLHSGLSGRFDWHGANYFEMMEELVLGTGATASLRRQLDSLFAGERLVYSGTYSKPSALPGRRWFLVEAFPPFGSHSLPYPYLYLSHRDLRIAVRSAPHRDAGFKPAISRRYLPICAACKSVPDSSGNWTPIEQFLKERLQVELTHDICPSCIAELYPQYAGGLNLAGSGH
ncbi:hypothetical protein F4V43_09810 [Paenibacillus spiritus]|uniref:PAS fold-4 domain-containing protein n=1 Tax=Paenibacillus spiritus TaxID=2496557 RepID=A0A5J5GA56_9BACL|nr:MULTISPECIES: hypothetical protein [Paenibacillus]KAA9004908.1 hypothetical protein F4V43_09810 [Paenibacillus spiritus]